MVHQSYPELHTIHLHRVPPAPPEYALPLLLSLFGELLVQFSALDLALPGLLIDAANDHTDYFF